MRGKEEHEKKFKQLEHKALQNDIRLYTLEAKKQEELELKIKERKEKTNRDRNNKVKLDRDREYNSRALMQ